MIIRFTRKLISGSWENKLMQASFFRFAVVGLITTTLDFLLFWVLTGVADIKAASANIVSYSCGISISFTLNRLWTFAGDRGGSLLRHEALKFFTTHVAGLTISTVLVSLLVLMLPAIAAKTISVPVVFVWNYLLARFWVFK
jgi:putative flippase GtrA